MKTPITYTFGPFRFCPNDLLLWTEGDEKTLTQKQSQILEILIRNAGHVVGKDEIMRRAWGEDLVVEEVNIARHIYALRGKLGGEQEEFIQTCPGRGYKFALSVDIEGEGMEESGEIEAAQIAEPVQKQPTNGGLDVFLGELSEGARAGVYLDIARRAAPHLTGPEQDKWLKGLTTQYSAFSEAIDWFGKNSAYDELELVTNLSLYWSQLGFWEEGRERLRHALARQGGGTSEVKAKAVAMYSHFLYQLDNYAEAKKGAIESVGMGREVGDEQAVAYALQTAARVAEYEGRYEEAKRLYREAIISGERSKDLYMLERIYNGLAGVARSEGDVVASEDFYHKSLQKAEEAGDKRGIAGTYCRLSVIAAVKKNIAQAHLFLEKSEDPSYGAAGKHSVALGQFNLGIVEDAADQLKASLAAFERALMLRREIGERRSVARAQEAIAKLHMRMDNYKEGARRFGEASALRSLANAPFSPAEEKRYRWWIDDAKKKHPGEFEEARKRALDEIIMI